MTGAARTARALGTTALVLAAGALLADIAGAPRPDLVTPLELALWIREARPSLDVVDTRDSAAFEAGHVPGARNVPADRLEGLETRPDETVVLYDEAGQGVAALAAAVSPDGSVEVYVLERGIEGWLDDVMAPRISDEASAAERAAFAEQAELSRWFGGIPRVVPAAELEKATESSAERSKRLLGGC